jgi:hypothetical protein
VDARHTYEANVLLVHRLAHINCFIGKSYKPPAARAPSYDFLREIADRFRMELSYEELSSLHGIIKNSVSSWNRLQDIQEPCLPVKYPRTPGYRPSPEENPYNAWSVYVSVTDQYLKAGCCIELKPLLLLIDL